MTPIEKSRAARDILESFVGNKPFDPSSVDEVFAALCQPYLAPYAQSHITLHSIQLDNGFRVFP